MEYNVSRDEKPLAKLILELETIKHKHLNPMNEEDQKELGWLMAYMNAANHLNFNNDFLDPIMPEDLNQEFVKEHMPYWFMSKEAGKDKYIYKLVEFRDTYCTGIRVTELMMRFLRSIEGTLFYAYEDYNVYMSAIKTLYNAAYGEFYINNPDHQYTAQEINILFLHRQIPFQIVQLSVVRLDRAYNAFKVMEVNW